MLPVFYWILILLWFLFGLFAGWPVSDDRSPKAFFPLGNSLLLFILFVIIGIKLFGNPLAG
jgi:hypothetical protein